MTNTCNSREVEIMEDKRGIHAVLYEYLDKSLCGIKAKEGDFLLKAVGPRSLANSILRKFDGEQKEITCIECMSAVANKILEYDVEFSDIHRIVDEAVGIRDLGWTSEKIEILCKISCLFDDYYEASNKMARIEM